MQRKIVLASASPRRQELIRHLQLEVEMIASSVDESIDPSLTPQQIVEELAVRKACSVAEQDHLRESDIIVIGSDTIVTLAGEIYGKPSDPEEAKRMLSKLQGNTHVVYTGLACVSVAGAHRLQNADDIQSNMPDAGKIVECGRFRIERRDDRQLILAGYTENMVTFRPMSNEEIQAYVQTGDPLDKAGSYGIQGIGSVFIEKLEGDFYSVVGLPLSLLYQMLVKLGIHPISQA